MVDQLSEPAHLMQLKILLEAVGRASSGHEIAQRIAAPACPRLRGGAAPLAGCSAPVLAGCLRISI